MGKDVNDKGVIRYICEVDECNKLPCDDKLGANSLVADGRHFWMVLMAVAAAMAAGGKQGD